MKRKFRLSNCKVLFYFLIFLMITAASIYSQKLSVTPADSMMDEPLSIRADSLKPAQPVIIRATTQDATGKLWQSYAGYYADGKGAVDLAVQAPANGTYSDVNSMGLIQSMNLPGADFNRARFIYKRAEPISFKFSLDIDGKTVDSIEITRRFMKPDAKMIDLRSDGLVGTLFVPSENGTFTGIIVLGGSEGGLNSEDVAAMLSSHGYAALALAYFGAEGLPQSLEEIPLEYFKRAIDWMKQQKFVKNDRIAFFGTSKGTEAALLVASNYKDVRSVVGYAPSAVVWSCICNTPDKSSWSFEGKSVPFIPFANDPTYLPPQGFPFRPIVNYQYRLQKLADAAQAEIPVERIKGPVLLISGEDDQLWMSPASGQMIMSRLKKNKHPFVNQHLVYKSAGHLIGKSYLPSGSTLLGGGRLMSGGTPEGNAKAQQDSWVKVLKFLNSSPRK